MGIERFRDEAALARAGDARHRREEAEGIVAPLDRANVALDISVAPDPAMLNDELSWTFTASNTVGPQDATNVEWQIARLRTHTALAYLQALGDRRAALLRNHGVVIAAEDVRWSVLTALALERAIRFQTIAGTLGHRFHSIKKDLKTLVFFSKVKIDKPSEKSTDSR